MRSGRLLIILLGLAVAGGATWWWAGRSSPQFGQEAFEQTRAILEHGPRPPGSEALDAVRKLVRDELEAAGWATEGQRFERITPIGEITFENVRARFRTGDGDPWQRQVKGLLCAHIDSKYYTDRHFVGADDAASACAAIVVIARYLARSRPAQAANLELVFFDGEESIREDMTLMDGLYGSRHYANLWRARDDKPRFGIVLDMIGHKNLSIRLPGDTPPDLKELVFEAARKEKAERYFGMAAGPILDDHVPLNHVGIPTVNLIGDFTRKGWWHTPSDNLNIISGDSLDISIRVTLRMLDELLKP